MARAIERCCVRLGFSAKTESQTEFAIEISVAASEADFACLSGIHKLIRRSPFGKGDKTHTSFCKVSVGSEREAESDVLNWKDLRVDFYKSSGPGGQHKNKTMSAVRLVHLPSGTIAIGESSRSQFENKRMAYESLVAKITEKRRLESLATSTRRRASGTDDVVIASYSITGGRAVNEECGRRSSDVKGVLDGKLDLIFDLTRSS